MLGKLLASKRIYDIINHAIEVRIQSGRHGDDTLQILLDSGDDRMVVLGVSDMLKSRVRASINIKL